LLLSIVTVPAEPMMTLVLKGIGITPDKKSKGCFPIILKNIPTVNPKRQEKGATCRYRNNQAMR
jgi:hypothetical protein